MDEKKTHATDRIAKAAEFALWAKDWIGDAVKASPEASIAWAGVCIVLPLLTNPRTADEANRDGFTYATARMRYYAALEPLLQQLDQDVGVTLVLMAEANEHIVVLYQHILQFQIRSVLRFYQSRITGYAKDMFLREDWKRMKTEIEKMEVTVNQNLTQINELVSTQKLMSLNKTSTSALGAMEQFFVNDAYEKILRKSKNKSMVRKVLSIILAASRPLTLSEMNVAVNIDEKSQSIDDLDLEDAEAFKSRLRSWCGLFVSIHHGRIYFLHQTAREFLLAKPPSTATVPSGPHWHRSIAIYHAQQANCRQLEEAWKTCLQWAESRGMVFAGEKS
ncbi:hypothetical protein C8A03DRAFT_39281, partial [Achaetomium macrosporum]